MLEYNKQCMHPLNKRPVNADQSIQLEIENEEGGKIRKKEEIFRSTAHIDVCIGTMHWQPGAK